MAYPTTESVDVVPCPFSYTTMATGHQFDLAYMVEEWDDTDSHVEELIRLDLRPPSP